jgi:hypothetical protein
MTANVGFAGEYFRKVFYFAHGGSGDSSGIDENNALPMTDADLMAIPEGTVVTNVYLFEDTAITGTTDIDVGDDDDADGFIDGSASLNLGTTGMYSWDAKNAGAYLRIETAGATDAGDIYVVPNAKYYAASGKEVKVDFTGTSTAGAGRVVVEGYYLGR